MRKFFHSETKQRIIEMSANIRSGMYETLSKARWIDETTRYGFVECCILDQVCTIPTYPRVWFLSEKTLWIKSKE